MTHLTEIKKIINKYARIKNALDSLEERTKLLNLEKNQIELELAQAREEERTLIDKIIQQTGKEPDFYKMLKEINYENS